MPKVFLLNLVAAVALWSMTPKLYHLHIYVVNSLFLNRYLIYSIYGFRCSKSVPVTHAKKPAALGISACDTFSGDKGVHLCCSS